MRIDKNRPNWFPDPDARFLHLFHSPVIDQRLVVLSVVLVEGPAVLGMVVLVLELRVALPIGMVAALVEPKAVQPVLSVGRQFEVLQRLVQLQAMLVSAMDVD